MPSHFDRAISTLGNIATHVGNTVGTGVNGSIADIAKQVASL